MDRNSLFAVAIMLTVALGGAYYYKTSNGQGFKGLDTIFAPRSSPAEDWKRDDPGWERLKSDPPADPTPPAAPTPPPQQPETPPSQPPRKQQPSRPQPSQPNCPG